ncbi:MAG: beta-ketoacyl synthase N-terminal-like domain-containing protein, partial [Solirubrobacteraceae bacterium]
MVTGLGAVTPLGLGATTLHDRWAAGEVGIAEGAGACAEFRPGEHLSVKEVRRLDRFAQFAVVAANEAILDAKLPEDEDFKERVGSVLGTGIGGIITFWQQSIKANEFGTWARTSPFFIPMLMSNAATAHISMRFGFRGPFFSAGSACASANDAVAVAYNY